MSHYNEEDFDNEADIEVEELSILDDDEEEEEDDEDEEEDDDVDIEVEEDVEENAENEDEEEEEEDDDAEDAIEDEVEDDEEGLNYKELYGEEPSKSTKKQRLRIERYCKSSKENVPRKIKSNECTHELKVELLCKVTTEKNAVKFAPLIDSKEKLLEVCGKFIHKEMNHLDLYKELQRGINGFESNTYISQKKLEEREIEIATTPMKVVEGMYQCSRCKSKKTYSRQVQTRSADEGMTSIIQCSECNKVWREYA